MISIQYPQLEAIAEDLHKVSLLVSGETGTGKSEAVKSLVQYIKDRGDRNENELDQVVFKCFDPSLAWWTSSPLKHRVRVREHDLVRNRIKNKTDTVYTTGELSIDDRKAFIASIISQDYSRRYQTIIRHGLSALQFEPLIIYIIEECQVVLGSYALRSRSPVADVMKDFISMGRNMGHNEHGLRAIAITQRMSEVSTEIVERCNLLLGKQGGANNLRKIKNASDKGIMETVKSLPRYRWTYYSGSQSPTFQFPRYFKRFEPEPERRGILARLLNI